MPLAIERIPVFSFFRVPQINGAKSSNDAAAANVAAAIGIVAVGIVA
jgi:hypothetical protein